MILLAFLSDAFAVGCPLTVSCNTGSGNVCQVDAGDAHSVLCDLDRAGLSDAGADTTLTVHWPGASTVRFESIDGVDSTGDEFCCDPNRDAGYTAPMNHLELFLNSNPTPTGTWSNDIDGSQTKATTGLWVFGYDGPNYIQGSNYVSGAEWDDRIDAGDGGCEVHGADGNDIIFGGDAGVDYLYGDAGDDWIIAANAHAPTPAQVNVMYGGTGDDRLLGANCDGCVDYADLGAGDDLAELGGGDDVACGGPGYDKIHGDGGDDIVFGGPDVDEGNIGGPGVDRCENDHLYQCEPGAVGYATACPAFP